MKAKIHNLSSHGSTLRATTLTKKLLLLLTASTLCLTAGAQINKGRMMLGAAFNTRNNKSTLYQKDTTTGVSSNRTSKFSSLTASVRYGYFIKDGWMIGLLGSYSTSTNESKFDYISGNNVPATSSYRQSSPEFSGGVFTRYYRMIGKSRFALFGELALSAGGGQNNNSSETDGVPQPSSTVGKSTYLGAVIRPGLTYFFNNVIAVEASFGNVGYNYSKTEYGNKGINPYSSNVSSGFTSRLDFSLNSVSLGINFYFRG